MKTTLMALVLFSLLVSAAGAVDVGLPSGPVANRIGFNVTLNPFTGDDQFSRMQALGSTIVRENAALGWSIVEHQKGVYDFANGADYFINQCTSRNMRPMVILAFGNGLYSGGTTSFDHEFDSSYFDTPGWRQGFTNYATASVTHYKGTGAIYEIYNEPNSTSLGFANAGVYMDLANQCIPAMRAADPNCTIIAPAVSTLGGSNTTAFLTTCFQRGLLNEVDAISVHPYRNTAPETVVNDYATIRSLMQTYGGKTVPIVSSEWGYSTGKVGAVNTPVATAQIQGDYVARMNLVNLSQNVTSIGYCFQDMGTDPNDYFQNFGTVTWNTDKPAYNEMKLLLTSLAGETFTSKLNDGHTSDWLLVFTSPSGHQTLAAWTTRSGGRMNAVVPGWGTYNLTSTPFYVNPVPEPVPLVLLATGLFGLLAYAWRKRK